MKNARFLVLIAIMLLVFSGFSMQAHAGLELLGQGTSTHGSYNLIYDADLDITWYDYSQSGAVWQQQMDWASALSVTFGSNTYNDWRLPITFDNACDGYNCTNSELGYVYYTELGNDASYNGMTYNGCAGPPLYSSCLTETGPFSDLQSGGYWSGTENSSLQSHAWYFYTHSGSQSEDAKNGDYYMAMAVRAGRAIVPEPISSLLFLTGGMLLAGRRFITRRHNKSVQ